LTHQLLSTSLFPPNDQLLAIATHKDMKPQPEENLGKKRKARVLVPPNQVSAWNWVAESLTWNLQVGDGLYRKRLAGPSLQHHWSDPRLIMNATDHHYDTVVDTDDPESCWCEGSF